MPDELLPKDESSPMTSLKPQTCESPDDVLRRIVRSCQPYGQVENVALFCRADRPEQLLCTVSMSGNLEAAAHGIGAGVVSGGRLSAFDPVPLSFKCARRLDGQVLRPMCSDCRWSGVQCRAQLD